MEEKIIEVLNQLRPYLNSDGGDLEFIKYQDGVVFVKLIGACGTCPHRNETIKGGLLQALKEKIPDIKDVINVEL
ncbi:MAG: NifU family protein [Bacilli bacterium]|nr:NifU family protein [Bacilli bacterium]